MQNQKIITIQFIDIIQIIKFINFSFLFSIQIIFIYTTLQISVLPSPQSQQNSAGRSYLTHLTLDCVKLPENQNCSKQIYDNFNFYEKLLFQRDEPYTVQEYNSKNINNIITSVKLEINNQPNTNETYELEVNATQITITAQSDFASARAFATLMQLSQIDQQEETDRKRYKIDGVKIQDFPQYTFRLYEADFCSHFTNNDDIYKTIDSVSMLKLNVLIADFTCAYQFPLLLNKSSLQSLASGAYSDKHFYDDNDLQNFAKYANERGVILVPKIELPGKTASWEYSGLNITAKCPQQAKSSINNIVLRMDKNETIQIVKDLITQIKHDFFEGLNVQPYIHFGGSNVQLKCLEEDPQVSNYVAKTPGASYKLIWQQFQNQINEYLQQSDIIGIYDENVINNNINVSSNSIIHFTTSTNKNNANNQNLKQIHSTQMYAHLMHPNSGYHYFWQDTWRDMMNVDINQNSKQGLTIGGGVVQTGRNCVGNSCLQHTYNRAIGASTKLWNQGGYRNSRDIDNFSCKLMKAGIPTGPLEISEPCLGYPFI